MAAKRPRGKRLEVFIDEKHAIWKYPPGQRAARVREALDLAGKIEDILGNISSRLDAMEAHLSRLEEKLDALSFSSLDGRKKLEEDKPKVMFDVDAFMNL
ncbi:MAG: hypothetical protein H0Z39_06965 [Peptococcaceae bacterium]|nr:hypothetical protein [Peptococcaceae bacterium]